MNTPYAQIYRASAGSGKTYLLVRKYINLLLKNTSNYKHILAVTFTNKATNEMKERILEELYLLSSGSNKSNYQKYFLKKLIISPNQLQQKAKDNLTKILHNYSSFAISTIDEFFVSVFKSFIRELNSSITFNIELDSKMILNYAIEEFISNLKEDSHSLKYLSKHISYKIAAEKSWKINDDILQLGKEIFMEKYKFYHSSFSQNLEDKKIIDAFIKNVNQKTKNNKIQLIELTEEIMELFHKQSLTSEEIKGKSNSVFAYFEKILNTITATNKRLKIDVVVNKTYENINAVIPKNSKDIVKQKIKEIYPELQEKIGDFLTLHMQYQDLAIISKNMYILPIIPDITTGIKDYLDSHSLVLLPDIMALINRVIANNHAPFIYEKVGNRIKHFLIDEFQDTSHMQWENFLPLLKNSLSENNEVLLVGDIKQSIFRWRNSDWKIMNSLAKKDLHPWKIKYLPIQENYRSCENIVTFNNNLYKDIITNLDTLKNTDQNYKYNREIFSQIKNAYQDVKQNIALKSKFKGNVRVKFFKDKTIADFKKNALIDLERLLSQLKEKSYQAKDIAILVRKLDDAKMIIEHFITSKKSKGKGLVYNIVSDESLQLYKALSIRILEQTIRFILTKDDFYKYTLRQLLHLYLAIKVEETFFVKVLNLGREKSLIELVECLISILDLHKIKAEYIYLLTFQDFVLDYYQKNYTKSLAAFLTYWEEKKEKICIPAEDNEDAVKISTIHKAKGLQFKVVIIPFCDWSLNKDSNKREILWEESKNGFNNLPILPIEYTASLINTSYDADYYIEKTEKLLDNLNLLYVATTRAQQSLYIYTFSFNKGNTIGKTLNHTMKNTSNAYFQEYWDEKNNIFNFGKLTVNSTDNNEDLSHVISLQNYTKPFINKSILKPQRIIEDRYKQISFSTLTPISKGIIYHLILQGIFTKNDISKAVNRTYLDGYISYSQVKDFKNHITALLSQEKIEEWFTPKWKVLNERWLVGDKHTKYRPDRIMIKGKDIIIVDYKFGEKKSSSHKKQLFIYKKLLQQFNYSKIEAYILYGLEGEVVQVA